METKAEIFLSTQSHDKSTVFCRGHFLTDCRLLCAAKAEEMQIVPRQSSTHRKIVIKP